MNVAIKNSVWRTCAHSLRKQRFAQITKSPYKQDRIKWRTGMPTDGSTWLTISWLTISVLSAVVCCCLRLTFEYGPFSLPPRWSSCHSPPLWKQIIHSTLATWALLSRPPTPINLSNTRCYMLRMVMFGWLMMVES